MGTRRLTRKEMKQDEFVSTVGKLTQWLEEKLHYVLWGAAGLVVLILAGFGLWSWQSAQEMRGQAALAALVETYGADAGSDAAGLPGAPTFATDQDKYRAVLVQAEQVMEEHGSTEAGEVGRFYRGLAHFELGSSDDARADFEEFQRRNPGHFLAPQARRKLAEVEERDGNLEAACNHYQALTESPARALPEEQSLIDLGRCLARKGDRTASSATYQRILDEFPDSIYATEARDSLSKLEDVGDSPSADG